MRWEQGRAAIERMVADGELQRVPASRTQADRLLTQARAHLGSAAKVRDDDPNGGYALAYDAARKALTAILENQGLISPADVCEDQEAAAELIDIASRVLDEMSPF